MKQRFCARTTRARARLTAYLVSFSFDRVSDVTTSYAFVASVCKGQFLPWRPLADTFRPPAGAIRAPARLTRRPNHQVRPPMPPKQPAPSRSSRGSPHSCHPRTRLLASRSREVFFEPPLDPNNCRRIASTQRTHQGKIKALSAGRIISTKRSNLRIDVLSICCVQILVRLHQVSPERVHRTEDNLLAA